MISHIYVRMLHAVLNIFWKQHPTKNSCAAIYLSSHKTFKDDQDMLGIERGQIHKQHSPIESPTWTH